MTVNINELVKDKVFVWAQSMKPFSLDEVHFILLAYLEIILNGIFFVKAVTN